MGWGSPVRASAAITAAASLLKGVHLLVLPLRPVPTAPFAGSSAVLRFVIIVLIPGSCIVRRPAQTRWAIQDVAT
jgi:hypothetical protein